MGKHDKSRFTFDAKSEAPAASVTEQPKQPTKEVDFFTQIGKQGTARVLARQHGLNGVGVVIEGIGGYFVTGGHLNKKTGEIE